MHRQPPWFSLASLSLLAACQAADAPSPVARGEAAIINGTDEPGNPAVGALVQVFGPARQAFCTSTLIRPNWVLTAAHCLAEAQVARTAFFVGQNVAGQGKTFAAKQFYVHPRYAPTSAGVLNDIALMELEESVPADVATPVPFNVAPLETEVGKDILYVGYGVVDGVQQNGSGQKRRTTIPLDRVDPITCSSKYEGTGLCFGDSGGPGLLEIDGQVRVISVNSTVNGCIGDNCDPCKGSGSNTTRVDAFADWIASTIGEDFEKCTQNLALCDCPAACQADGVCDNVVCPTDSCKSALDCVLDDCEAGLDGSCAQACAQGASLGAQMRLGTLFDCAAEGCVDAETAEQSRACLAEKCASQLADCEKAAGASSCTDAFACATACGDAACEATCAAAATVDAQEALALLRACQSTSCAGKTGDELTTCLASACPEAYEGCFPPDHCEPGSDACPVGRSCEDTPTGETSCQDQPDVPPAGDGDADGSAGDGDDAPGDDGASGNDGSAGGDGSAGPVDPGSTTKRDDGGCQLQHGARGARPSMLWLALLLAGGALVRRRTRTR